MKPRKPFGNPPGRLAATMLKVLAAELSDGPRLARGKALWADDAVVDITVGRGVATAEVQGSRRDPYTVTLEAEPGDGTPPKRDVWAQCTCPDDTGDGRQACKHAVAALFALADEVAVEPDLLARWRSGRARNLPGLSTPPGNDAATSAADRPSVRHLHAVPDGGATTGASTEQERDPGLDLIAGLLAAPAGAAPPEFAPLAPLDHALPPGRLWAEVLDTALDDLEIPWD